MIRTLPERTRKALASVRQDLQDLVNSAKMPRPLSNKTVLEWVQDIIELWPDLEEDILTDLDEAHESGEVWHPDDQVVLADLDEGGYR